MWEVKCDMDAKSVESVALGAQWPSVYFHSCLSLLLIIYVDDFKLAGPSANLESGRALLRTKLPIGPEGPLSMHLDCNQTKNQASLPGGSKANVLTYDMESSLEQ